MSCTPALHRHIAFDIGQKRSWFCDIWDQLSRHQYAIWVHVAWPFSIWKTKVMCPLSSISYLPLCVPVHIKPDEVPMLLHLFNISKCPKRPLQYRFLCWSSCVYRARLKMNWNSVTNINWKSEGHLERKGDPGSLNLYILYARPVGRWVFAAYKPLGFSHDLIRHGI